MSIEVHKLQKIAKNWNIGQPLVFRWTLLWDQFFLQKFIENHIKCYHFVAIWDWDSYFSSTTTSQQPNTIRVFHKKSICQNSHFEISHQPNRPHQRAKEISYSPSKQTNKTIILRLWNPFSKKRKNPKDSTVFFILFIVIDITTTAVTIDVFPLVLVFDLELICFSNPTATNVRNSESFLSVVLVQNQNKYGGLTFFIRDYVFAHCWRKKIRAKKETEQRRKKECEIVEWMNLSVNRESEKEAMCEYQWITEWGRESLYMCEFGRRNNGGLSVFKKTINK